MTVDSDKPASLPRGFGGWLRDMPRWKKIAVAAAIGTLLVGGIWSLTGEPPPPSGNGGSLSGLSATLVDGQPTTTAGPTPASEPAAKGVFRLGFSFLAGFSIGSFLRATLKIAAIAFGFWLFLTMLLSYYGILVVDWNQMDSLWNRFATNVEQEWASFQTFMTGSLPAAGLAAAGFAIGLKRH
jgi:uncharacterized membrane protein (Fun14 family)